MTNSAMDNYGNLFCSYVYAGEQSENKFILCDSFAEAM